MHSDLVEIGWTEEHWNRITTAVTEEAQKARVAAQMLPAVGPEDPTTVAVPEYLLGRQPSRRPSPPATAIDRLTVDSDPTLFLTTIAVNVSVRMREAADSDLNAALVMFRRAANYIARIEDALIFNGRPGPSLPPPFGSTGIPPVFDIDGNGAPSGLLGPMPSRVPISILPPGPPPGAAVGAPTLALGDQVVTSIIQAINLLDSDGQLGPYACALSSPLFEAICTPNPSLVLPRDRILPFLQGPLLRSSAILGVGTPANVTGLTAWGVVVALSGNPVEIVVASDINVRFLQTTEEPRLVFRVSERIALRLKEPRAVQTLVHP